MQGDQVALLDLVHATLSLGVAITSGSVPRLLQQNHIGLRVAAQ